MSTLRRRTGTVLFLVLGFSALALGGCARQQSYSPSAGTGAAYAPYDEQTNPQCGALGTCQPLNTQPYPMHGNID